MAEAPASLHRIAVPARASAADASYEVLTASGLRRSLPDLLARYGAAHRYAIISDSTVAELYGGPVLAALRGAGQTADLFPFPAGEAHKTRASWASLSDALLGAGFGRDAAVVALGGGVVGDLAGFVAATYMRGLPWVQVPTTLLSMVDASIGGKTGVDTPMGKNLIGAFHPPRLVIADPEVLRTLPAAQLRSGLAEAVKHGVIADAGHLDWIESYAEALLAASAEPLQQLILRSIEIKASIVGRDERESGPRKLLNFGHTLGHALESASGFGLLHGEAISIGMVLEARLGEAIGVTAAGTADRLRRVLEAVGLPVAVPVGLDPEQILALTRSDKKARGGQAEYALIAALGRGAGQERWSWPVPDEAVRKLLVVA